MLGEHESLAPSYQPLPRSGFPNCPHGKREVALILLTQSHPSRQSPVLSNDLCIFLWIGDMCPRFLSFTFSQISNSEASCYRNSDTIKTRLGGIHLLHRREEAWFANYCALKFVFTTHGHIHHTLGATTSSTPCDCQQFSYEENESQSG